MIIVSAPFNTVCAAHMVFLAKVGNSREDTWGVTMCVCVCASMDIAWCFGKSHSCVKQQGATTHYSLIRRAFSVSVDHPSIHPQHHTPFSRTLLMDESQRSRLSKEFGCSLSRLTCFFFCVTEFKCYPFSPELFACSEESGLDKKRLPNFTCLSVRKNKSFEMIESCRFNDLASLQALHLYLIHIRLLMCSKKWFTHLKNKSFWTSKIPISCFWFKAT